MPHDIAHLDPLLQEMTHHVEQLLMLLSEREKFVIERRFALKDNGRLTLEEIGRHFSVTRERVRQIEKSALQKLTRNVGNFDVFAINSVAHSVIESAGGLLAEDKVVNALLKKDYQYTKSALLFILSLDKRFVRSSNTIKMAPHFCIQDITPRILKKVTEKSIRFLRQQGDVASLETLYKDFIQKEGFHTVISLTGLRSLYDIHKELKVVGDKVGLMSWKHIHPRTLRDKIYFILRREKQAMHFVDLANAIVEASFDRKTINLQAVHNELIRHDDFVLIGRGIYALKEWGYTAGTVADVIESVLLDKGEITEEQIIAEVLKKRQVKPITISLNLKNKPQFIRTGKKVYALKR